MQLTKLKMKKLIAFLGLLDILTLIRGYKSVLQIFEFSDFSLFIFFNAIFYCSLLFSGILTLRLNKIGLIIYYFQFPLRLLFASFSFGFLYSLNPLLFDSQGYGLKILSVILGLLEVGRLILTIKHHRTIK
jgi:hypothetical protein